MKSLWINQINDKTGKRIGLYGWVHSRRDHGKIIFVDLRDRSGIVQIVFSPENQEIYKIADSLKPEDIIFVSGLVVKRPKGMENPNLITGEVEVMAERVEILSFSKPLPFPIDSLGYEINEEIRLKYRYLDLKRERLKNNLILRHKVIKFIRDYLNEKDFIEVETPILSKSTPEGARDYVVPSRLYPKSFYALPQSPQQYKQLLMVAGIERYFQIARCFRDEDTRGDRQPEFTQLDIEMSFIEKEDILNLIEDLYIKLIKELFPNKKITKIPFPRLRYKEVIERFKSDKPDLRKNKDDKDELSFLFITDFPMFEWHDSEKKWDAVHHPFTMPKDDKNRFIDITKIRWMNENIDKVLAEQYDLVLNGYEIGGGSIRIKDPKILISVFKILGHKEKDIKEKFGHLLTAFEYGIPPHGGIALGLDRFLMILAKEPNIREVIAFPKTGDVRDPMMNSPSKLSKKQLKELKIKFDK